VNRYTVICDWANRDGSGDAGDGVVDSDEVVVFAESETAAVALASAKWRMANEGVLLADAWVLTPERRREFL